MQLKRLALSTVAYVMLALIITVPALAAGEQGTGILYAYTDPERTTLVEVDSNGRYYVVPGTKYYFTIAGIQEHDVGEEITIWAFRVNTAENVTIGNAIVDADSSLVFDWTIPEDWLDEAVKIKYGTSLDSDWFYAQKEIWVNCRIGTGILRAYDANGEASRDAEGNYLVYPGAPYDFTIEDISEYSSDDSDDDLSVWALCGRGHDLHNVLVASGDPPNIAFHWTIPSDVPVGASIKFKYGIESSGPKPNWYFARNDVIDAPRLLLVIPGVFLGSIGAITALFSGWAVKTLLTRRR